METELAESSEPPPERRLGGQEALPTLLAPDFVSVLALFVAFRLLALFLLRPGGFIRDWSDFDTFLGFASVSDYGLYPFLNYWLEWPPLVPWLAVGAYKLSLLLPVWPDDSRLWFVLILGGIFVLFEAGNLALIFGISSRLYGSPATGSTKSLVLRPVWLYTLLFVPLYTVLGFFDSIALFFVLLALYFALRDGLVRSAMSVGVGFMVKLMPVVFVPVALRQLWSSAGSRSAGLRDSALYAVSTALTILALVSPFALTQPSWLLAMLRAVAGRSSWETVWALMEGYHGFGVVLGDRLNPAETSFAAYPATLPWFAIMFAFAVFYLVVWLRRADYRQPRNVVALTGFTMTVFLLSSKGFSPQFLVYLLPFIILLFPNRRGVTYCLLLTLLNVLEQPGYFVLVPDVQQLLVGVVVGRWLVLGALLLEFVSAIWKVTVWRLESVRRYAPAALVVLVAAGLVAGFPSVARSYGARQLRLDPAASLIGYLGTAEAQSQAGLVVVGDQAMLRRFRPYLGHVYEIRTGGGDTLPQGAANLALEEALAGAELLWFVTDGSEGASSAATANLGRPLLDYRFEASYRLLLLARRDAMTPQPPVSRLANGVNLIGHELSRPSPGQVLVTLYWWASSPTSQSYTVFTQVLDGDGKFVAGHDGFPVNGNAPTHSWQPGRVYGDSHVIDLPPNLVSSHYQVVAGMYDLNTRRVVASGPNGDTFKDSAVPLGEMQLP